MIPHLPVELLRLIVDIFQLPSFSSYRRTRELEDETRSTLYNLCITSHIFRQIAQPLLFSFARIWNDEHISRLVENNSQTDHLKHVRVLAFDNEAYTRQAPFEPRISQRFAARLEQLIAHNRFSRLQCFSGSSQFHFRCTAGEDMLMCSRTINRPSASLPQRYAPRFEHRFRYDVPLPRNPRLVQRHYRIRIGCRNLLPSSSSLRSSRWWRGDGRSGHGSSHESRSWPRFGRASVRCLRSYRFGSLLSSSWFYHVQSTLGRRKGMGSSKAWKIPNSPSSRPHLSRSSQ